MNDKYKISELQSFGAAIMNTQFVQDFVGMVKDRAQAFANFLQAEPSQQASFAPARVQQDPRRPQ